MAAETMRLSSHSGSNILLRLQEFPRAASSGTPSGGGVYLTVYPSSRPNTDTVYTSLVRSQRVFISFEIEAVEDDELSY